MSFLFKLNLIFNHHFFCQKTSTFLGFLYKRKHNLNEQLNNSSRRQTRFTRWIPSRFRVEKTIQYSIILGITFRAFYISTFTTQTEMTAHLPFSPLMISACTHFNFLNSNVLRCSCLLTFFLLFLDYSLYFRLDSEHLQASQEILVENGRHFVELNSGVSSNTLVNGKFWLKALFKQIWKYSSFLHFYKPSLHCFPALSPSLRAQLIVLSAITEMLVVALNIAICKCS